MTGSGRLAITLGLTLAVIAASAPAGLASGQPNQPRTTLADVEEEVMCTVCGVPLSMAREAPAAKRERALIRDLIAQGKTKQEIKDELVATYGSGVLMMPGREGFDLAAWLVPLGLLAIGLAVLAWLLASWRRRSGTTAPDPAVAASPLSPDDAELVDSALRERD